MRSEARIPDAAFRMLQTGAGIQDPNRDNIVLPSEYEQELDDAIFRQGEVRGRITTSLSMLTDSLLELNALEVYYQKPIAKAVAPAEIELLRRKLTSVKELLRQAIAPGLSGSGGADDRGAVDP